jgi:ligand-binding sensor domain-containing protein/serine phosphatase RsbU (regulator of sigma subunit)
MTRILIALFIFIVSQALSAQQFYFANYTLNDGLPHSRVNAIHQGKDGYLWLATNMGISRFDGHVFTNFTFKDGLADNKVTSIIELESATYLLGHENGELTYFSPGIEIKRIKLDVNTNRIFSFSRDSSNYLWIATQTTGVYHVSMDDLINNLIQRKFDHFDADSGLARDVTSVMQDASGTIWFVTDLGIKRQSKNSKEFEFYLPKNIDFGQFSSITQDKNLNLWLGTVTSGVYKVNPLNERINHFSVESGHLHSNFISFLQENSKGEMMVGTWGGGFSIIKSDGNSETIAEANGLSENKVRCIAADQEGNIWVGTNQNGLSCFRGKQFELFLKSKDGTNTQIGAILQDRKGNSWMGSINGIYFMPAGSNQQKKIDFITGGDDIEVTSLLEDRVGNIWVSTWGAGILIINPTTFSVQRFAGKLPYSEPGTFTEQYVHTLRQSSKGQIWISMLRGVSVFNPSQNTLTTYTQKDGLAENNTTDIEEDNNGIIWIGSASSGLTYYEKGKFKKFESKETPIYPAISSISRDETGKIWVATEGGGIYSILENKVQRYTTKEGLSSNYISLIESDLHGKLWLGTNKGLCVWNPENRYSRLYDKSDKNSRIEPKPNAVFRDKENRIWIGTINGVLLFDPEAAQTNYIESRTHITAIKVYQDTIDTDGITLNYKQNYLSFFFNGICFSDPEKVRFKYRLIGFDDRWQEQELNFITFNNLAPNNYTFELKSCNNDGVWNKEAVKFSFIITPPYWMTWWFYTIVVASIVILVVLFIKFRERNLRLEKRHLEQMVNERTAEIVHQKEEIENQRDELRANSDLIEQKNLSITDSIRYARRIQMATLPYNELIFQSLPESFIYYQPKDIVSGDFYAFARRGSKILMAVADCTGHGVPGAFMSMIGTNLFNQIINEKGITQPSIILDELDSGIERALKQDESDNHDGMDIVIVCLDFEKNEFEMAGANRPLWIVRRNADANLINSNSEIYGNFMEIIRPDKHPIGGFDVSNRAKFTNRKFQFSKGDMLYLSTDGYSDQFGGPLGKKLLSKRLRDKLIQVNELNVSDQQREIDAYFEDWRGELEQVDDVLLVGIRHHG